MSADLFSSYRRKHADAAQPKREARFGDRTEFERDSDRILFSSPVRRLADKTQVFPLDAHDTVRTRLTHSHEVANLARSFGTALVAKHKVFEDVPDAGRNIPALLGACGLAHDLGNPPFGHQGEEAIKQWFEEHDTALKNLDRRFKNDFLNFDGNAQTIRLVTRLQIVSDDHGMNLTVATLAAMMKYPSDSTTVNKSVAATKKVGVFQSELDIAEDVWTRTGLGLGKRHPCAVIVEACDDIAYSVLDVEDAVKKRLTSFGDLMFHLAHEHANDPVVEDVLRFATKSYDQNKKHSLSPAELDDISMQMFRVHALDAMMDCALESFVANKSAILTSSLSESLIDSSSAKHLCQALKEFARGRAYNHKSVVEKEIRASHQIKAVMSALWPVVSQLNASRTKPSSTRDKYVYSLVSESYRRVFNSRVGKASLPDEYLSLQLMTDMVSGMTDTYLTRLYEDLKVAGAISE